MWMGVDLFFVLSGFLITGILLKQRTKEMGRYFKEFYARRVRRILPPYLLLLVVATAVFGFAWMRHIYLYFGLMNFMLAFQLPMPSSLSVLWSLAVEEQFYLLWPFAVYLLSEAALGWTTVALIVAAPILRFTCTPLFANYWPIYSLTPFRMDLLLIGGLLAIGWRNHRATIERYGHYGLAMPFLAAALLYYAANRYHFTTTTNSPGANALIYELSLIACAGFVLWALSGRWVKVLTLPPITYLGRISYTVYLIHTTALLLAHEHLSHYLAVVAGTTGTLIYAELSWRFLEEPLLGRQPKEASVVVVAD